MTPGHVRTRRSPAEVERDIRRQQEADRRAGKPPPLPRRVWNVAPTVYFIQHDTWSVLESMWKHDQDTPTHGGRYTSRTSTAFRASLATMTHARGSIITVHPMMCSRVSRWDGRQLAFPLRVSDLLSQKWHDQLDPPAVLLGMRNGAVRVWDPLHTVPSRGSSRRGDKESGSVPVPVPRKQRHVDIMDCPVLWEGSSSIALA